MSSTDVLLYTKNIMSNNSANDLRNNYVKHYALLVILSLLLCYYQK